MDHVEIDAHMEKVKATMEANEGRLTSTVSFQDVLIVHLWERIKDLEDEVSILMTAHMNRDSREVLRERLRRKSTAELNDLFRQVTSQPDAGGSEP